MPISLEPFGWLPLSTLMIHHPIKQFIAISHPLPRMPNPLFLSRSLFVCSVSPLPPSHLPLLQNWQSAKGIAPPNTLSPGKLSSALPHLRSIISSKDCLQRPETLLDPLARLRSVLLSPTHNQIMWVAGNLGLTKISRHSTRGTNLDSLTIVSQSRNPQQS